MAIKILNKREKQEIANKLNEQFGIEKIPGIIIRLGKERLFLFTGTLNEQQIKELEKIAPVEKAGFYFAKIFEGKEEQIRLSIEGVQILKEQIRKNIFEINDKQTEQWMKGYDLEIKTNKRGFIVIKNKEDFLGSGKASEQKIGNFIPKSRRLREKNG